MKTNITFKEIQRQDQKWIWFLLIVILGIVLFGFVQQVIFNKPFGTHPVPDWVFTIFFALSFFGLWLVYSSELQTRISRDNISFRYLPFQAKDRIIEWKDINSCYVRLYDPIREYGGFGIRIAFTRKNGKAFNVSGNKGIQIELKNGERILIGTHKPIEADEKIKLIMEGL